MQKGALSVVKRAEFFSCRKSYIILRGRWCDVIIPNAGDKSDEKKVRFYE
jgi:hypothetical protein